MSCFGFVLVLVDSLSPWARLVTSEIRAACGNRDCHGIPSWRKRAGRGHMIRLASLCRSRRGQRQSKCAFLGTCQFHSAEHRLGQHLRPLPRPLSSNHAVNASSTPEGLGRVEDVVIAENVNAAVPYLHQRRASRRWRSTLPKASEIFVNGRLLEREPRTEYVRLFSVPVKVCQHRARPALDRIR